MKRHSFFMVLLIFLVGCSSTENQKYVKNIMLSLDNGKYIFTVECYDFSVPDENYIYESYSGDSLEQLCLNATSSHNYNYRLCENIYISSTMFDSSFSKTILGLNRLKIPVTANILCYISDSLPANNISDYKLIRSTIFDVIEHKNKISGFFQVTDSSKNNNGAVLVSNGEVVKLLNEKQWNIFNVFTGKAKNFSYTFRDGTAYCKLENCKVMYAFDGSLNIDIYVKVKDYKGVNNSAVYQKLMREFLERDIRDTAYELYNDTLISDNSNLHWYCKQIGKECTGVNINVHTI